MSRVLVIGIDGASYKLVQRWRNYLPNLERLAEKGASGFLRSSVPPDSSPAWVCFYTGKNPGKIGIFGFQNVESDGTITIPDSTLCDSLSLWEILSLYGKRVCVLNVPLTYPPREVNGCLVSGFPVPFSKHDYTFPPYLAKELDRIVGGYQTDTIYSSPFDAGEEAFLQELMAVHNKTLGAAKYLLKKEKWDFFMVVFREVDYVQHFFWKYLDAKNSRYKHVIRDWYRRMDKTVGDILALTDEETYTFIMSDHGFEGARYKFCLNEWLQKKGLLKTSENVKMAAFVAEEGFKLSPQIMARKFLLTHINPILIKKLLKIIPPQLLMKVTFRGIARKNINLLFSNIDWPKTKAFAIGGTWGAIYLRMDGQDQQSLDPDERKNLRIRIERLLEGISREKWHKNIRVNVSFRRREGTFSGKYAHLAPDLMVDIFTDDSKCHIGAEMEKGDILYPINTQGVHSYKGVWVARGPSTKKISLEAGIVDLAPTILYLFDLPIPKDLDGKVAKEAFTLDRKIRFGESLSVRAKRTKSISRQDMEKMKGRLKALGYLG